MNSRKKELGNHRCIACGACEPACPVTAIFEESDVPEEWKHFLKINADYYKG